MARTRKVVYAVEEVKSPTTEMIEVYSKYKVAYLPNHSHIEFVDGKAMVTKEQENILKQMGVI